MKQAYRILTNFVMPLLIISALIFANELGVGAAEPGTIAGNVKVLGAINSANVVVYLESVGDDNFDAPSEHAIMDQKNKEYIPHVLPIVKGTTVDFVNSDDGIFHNVHAYREDKSTIFNVAMPFAGTKYSRKFDNEGEVLVLCDKHQEMRAYIVVLPNPYFAKTNKYGDFVIKNVPPGKYTLKTWHENRQPESQEIVVEPGKITKVNLILKEKKHRDQKRASITERPRFHKPSFLNFIQ